MYSIYEVGLVCINNALVAYSAMIVKQHDDFKIAIAGLFINYLDLFLVLYQM